ncbi:MAG: 4-alpha-glucanotransferase [Desulfobacterales bacterium]
MSVRSSGILLHPSSLPSDFGIGDLGPSAFRFADFLLETGQRLWQVLPLNPTDGAYRHSPYHSSSAFAGNPLLISPQVLVRQGLLKASDLHPGRAWPKERVEFNRVVRLKQRLLLRACDRSGRQGDGADYERFCQTAGWLDDFALYAALRDHCHPKPWWEWPRPLRDRNPGALAEARRKFGEAIRIQKRLQHFFFRQWFSLKEYCNDRRIRLIGDMPIYVPLDSADVWAHRECFQLTRSGLPAAVSGVPPDYFSATGQLWGHPVYDWDFLTKDGYGWWIGRMQQHLRLYDLTRIDHFRGLVAYWEVPAGEPTAVNGRWVPAPVEDFLDTLVKRFGALPVIAEDLGTITADVREVIRRYDFPGMRVILFAFGEDFPDNCFLPHHHVPNCVVYTGTHDNNTVRGWFEDEADQRTKRNLIRYLGREVQPEKLHWDLIRLAMRSTAETAVVPLQDILGLGSDARMNRPARRRGNWRWRFGWDDLDTETKERLRDVTEACGRL